MSDDQDKDSKTEAPSEKKISDAAEKGNVPFSREATMFASTLAIYIFFVFFLTDGVATLTEALKDIFEQPEAWRLENATDVVALITHLIWKSTALVVPAFVLLIVFGVGASIFQNLPVPVLDRIQPKLNRVSPMAGLKRIFGIQGLVEFGKSLFKIIIVSVVVVLVLWNDYFATLDLMFSDPVTMFSTMASDLNEIMIVILLSTAVLAIADLFWSRHHWYTELMMTKQEVKEEMKQAQGDPIVKSRLRSMQRDRARKRMISSVPRATLVIANPTHYAVALRYVREESDAPVVVAMGQDLVALKIREIAEKNGVPVFEDPPLARSMFAQVSVDSVIPPVFYKAVAELIHRVHASQPKRMT
ncbi:flagellar biosynthesis protein FlhB [Ensifer adhaerens]|jgi:flagellar biosynthetic protein FlhB|uniref:Flagellar biosynthetic protein FlhB n=1 Tax=Ensifer adhaerens TaxID=106592 RepID=A0A9Q9DA56_ENSAD|nr:MULTISPECIES: flagellar biosynthesis protein FlhB [Ensifer]KSV68443.1 flagellar biosynthesis protein FlhB [Sinorhizobium sp. GW3]KSV77888.1 flagellar biosynthesis protein FlhB [Sinorhizobium sp. GL2]OWZ95197.1 flagellar biosynthesis protein FlhB [Sinorhizobium sp. LM21]ANK71393.1 flagellar biosynthesis protein FlhB [Ensifer adhaerens]KDP73690.1 flagellar biosynthesis protein FlhB [Ensifer adhaerens]